MRILVCITHVPDTTTRIRFDGDRFDSEGVQYIIGPYDDYAISKAVDLKYSHSAHVTVLNVGLPETEPSLRRALALGADEAIRINAHPADSFFVSSQIAGELSSASYDLVLMGRESIDYNTGAVHTLTGQLAGIPSFSPVMDLKIETNTANLLLEIEGGREVIECGLPFIAGCQEPIAEWKIPNMRGIMTAKSKPLKVKEAVFAETRVITSGYETATMERHLRLIDKDNPGELVKILREEAKVI